MHRSHFLVVLILIIAPPLVWSQESQEPDRLWSWFGNCSQKRYMGLEVVLSRKVIYRSSFPTCPISDYSKKVQDLLSARGTPARRKLVFSFKGGHIFQGEYHTTPTQTIEGNVWQAGTGPGAILFGISFATKKQVLLNTIHVAQLGSASLSEIDPGLTIRTFPISHKHAE